MAGFSSLPPELVWAVLSRTPEQRRAASPTCRLWEQLVRQHQTSFKLDFDYHGSEKWEDEGVLAALGPALARRPALRILRAWSLDCVRADVAQSGMLGDFRADAQALEPAAEIYVGFVAGRMPVLETLSLASSYRSMHFVARLPAWAACMRHQLRSLEMEPVGECISPEVCRMTALTRLALNNSRGDIAFPAGITALHLLRELRLEGWGSLVGPGAGLERLSALPDLRFLFMDTIVLPGLEWLQGLTGLERLILPGCQKLVGEESSADFEAPDFLPALQGLASLKHLHLNHSSASFLLSALELPHLPHLTALCISGSCLGGDLSLTECVSAVRTLLGRLPSLRHLCLSGASYWLNWVPRGTANDEAGQTHASFYRRLRAAFPQLSFERPADFEIQWRQY